MTEGDARPRRVVYLTGTRADFGLMRSTLLQVAEVSDLSLLVTGMHLDPRFGQTIRDVEASGLPIAARLPCDLSARTGASMALALADILRGVTLELQRIRPDVLLLLGDRGEMLAGAIAAVHLGIVVMHVHGGERSGTVDESLRHAISKLAHYHFVATQGSRERLLRMGECDARIFVTGAPGLDDALAEELPTGAQVRQALGLAPTSPFLLVVFHPVVQQADQAYAQTRAVMDAVREIGLATVWMEPNADAGSADIVRAVHTGGLPPGSVVLQHLPRPLFLAAMRDCAALVGNSSAGIIEAASFSTVVVNVGDRQRLRDRSDNVLDVPCQRDAMVRALRQALGGRRVPRQNPWGDGRAGARIAELVRTVAIDAAVLEKVNSY